MPARRRVLSAALLATSVGFVLACADIAGSLTGATVTVEMNEAGGLRAGDAVLLNGLEIGSIKDVSFSAGGDGVLTTLSVGSEHMTRLDPQTVFMVRDTETNPPLRVLVASNVCIDSPQGIAEGQVLHGYAGGMVKVLLLAGIENPDCAGRLADRWMKDLERSLDQLNQAQ